MKLLYNLKTYFFPIVLLTLITSCKKDFFNDNYTAYFGGEVANPSSRYVLFCKNNKVIDTIPLNSDNTFFKKFDSLTPGLYTFKHDPEFQYVYFDKNDSLRVHIDTKDFDNSIMFCGRGDEKNNFLMEMYLRNEKDKDKVFEFLDKDFKTYNDYTNQSNKENIKFYNSKKEEIKWNDDFDLYAKTITEFPFFTKKEIYPVIHKVRTGEDVVSKLPKDYYAFRKGIDVNNEKLINFMPFMTYLDFMMNNVVDINENKSKTNISENDLAMRNSINKLKVADTLFKNQQIKNIVLNNIAFKYMLEDQNMVNNNLFLDTYYKFSTDKTQKNEIVKLGNAIQLLKPNFDLPRINLKDVNGKIVSSDDLISKNTVIYFWSEKLNSHLIAVHKKIIELKAKYPNYNFIGINLNDSDIDWQNTLSKYTFDKSKEFKCDDFENIKAKWAITKIHRTIILKNDKKIKNAFTNIFDINFEKELK